MSLQKEISSTFVAGLVPATHAAPQLNQRRLLLNRSLSKEILNAVMDATAAHSTMSEQALDSEKVRDGLKDVLLGPAQLYEALREKAGRTEAPGVALTDLLQ